MAERELPVGEGDGWTAALAAWDRRVEIALARRASERFETLARLDFENPAPWGWCARALYFLADHEPSRQERESLFERGCEVGRRAIDLGPDLPGAYYWTAACLASFVDLQTGNGRSMYAPELVRYLRRVRELDPAYHYHGLARIAGQAMVRQPGLARRFLPHALPEMSPEGTLKQLAACIESGPPVVLTHQTYGQLCYAARGDRQPAREMLEALESLDLDAAECAAPENHLDLSRARSTLTALL